MTVFNTSTGDGVDGDVGVGGECRVHLVQGHPRRRMRVLKKDGEGMDVA